MTNYLFITDPHFTLTSNVRVGNYLQDLIDKLDFVVEVANEKDATVVIGGDFHDKPTVADIVKNAIIKSLKKAKYVPYVIFGNHDTLFDNRDNDVKTSLQVLIEAGVVRKLTYEHFGDHVLTNEPVMKEEGVPQFGVYHGFLNKQDGRNTFLFDQIQTKDPSIVCLGHDHITYKTVRYGNTDIYRIGSFARGIRNDEISRIPLMLFISIGEGKIETIPYEIKCKNVEWIFKTKKAAVPSDYTSLIKQITQLAVKEVTFLEAVSQVSDKPTYHYIKSIVDKLQTNVESK